MNIETFYQRDGINTEKKFDPNFHLPNSAMDAWVIEIQQLNPNLVESINFALIINLMLELRINSARISA